MRVRKSIVAVAAAALLVPLTLQQEAVQAQAPGQAQMGAARPIHVYLRAGLKTHGEGQHDYPQFLADWSKMLTERGAIVDGSLHFPTEQELEGVDVIVMYKGDAGYLTPREKATLEGFLARGGGIVGFHDTICAEDADYWSTIFGGAKKHGEVNYTLEAPVAYEFTDAESPITAGAKPFTITDESFFLMTWSKQPEVHVLATAAQAATPSAGSHAGEVVPQMWTYERPFFPRLGGQQPFRAFVWMQGHNYANLTNPEMLPILLRGIAWAAKAPLDSLMTVRPARGAGGGRGAGRGAGRAGGGRGPGAGRQGGGM